MRKKPPPEPKGDVPLWFMTYSDVITLMMTFFILLLTFATSEPERFEQMKISVFGSSGANGLVGDRPEGPERDSWMLRVRSRASRLTDRGTEVPPESTETPTKSLNEGLAGLEKELPDVVESVSIVIPGHSIGSQAGELYEYGTHNISMLAKMMRLRGYGLTIEISHDTQLDRALACIQYLYHVQGVSAERLQVCHDRFSDLDGNSIRMKLRHFEGNSNVEARTQAPE